MSSGGRRAELVAELSRLLVPPNQRLPSRSADGAPTLIALVQDTWGLETDAAADVTWELLEHVVRLPEDGALGAGKRPLLSARMLLALPRVDPERDPDGTGDDLPSSPSDLVPGTDRTFSEALAAIYPAGNQAGPPRLTEKVHRSVLASAVSENWSDRTNWSKTKPGLREVADSVLTRLQTELKSSKLRDELVDRWRARKAAESILCTAPHSHLFRPVGLAGWGPPREPWVQSARPRQPSINTRKDHPVLGDTRSFFQFQNLRDDETVPISWSHLTVPLGARLRGYIYVNNDADPTMGEEATARDVIVRLQMARDFVGERRFDALVTSTNAQHPQIWEGLTLTLPSSKDHAWPRLFHSAWIVRERVHVGVEHGAGDPEAKRLIEPPVEVEAADLLRDGVVLGDLPPTDDLITYIVFDLVLDFRAFKAEIGGRRSGSVGEHQSWVHLNPGTVAEIQLTFANTGTTLQPEVPVEFLPIPAGLPLRRYDDVIEYTDSTLDGHWHPREIKTRSDGSQTAILGPVLSGESFSLRYRLAARDATAFEYEHGYRIEDLRLLRVFHGASATELGMSFTVIP